MTSKTHLRLPMIDFSEQDLKPGTSEWDSVRSQVRRALEEYGCFEARFDKVPPELRKAVFGASEELFDLPLQTKMQNVSKKPFYGYCGQDPTLPLYESVGIDDAKITQKVEDFTNILWPEGNTNFSNTIQSFVEEVSELNQTIRRMIFESFGLEKYMDEHMDSTNYLLRVMKYKGPKTTETKFGLKAHTDKTIVTILCQNQVDGLEVQTKDGEWINVKLLPDSLIFMVGDYLYAYLNGGLHSPYHRVMMSGNDARYSVGLFSIPKEGYIIKAPEELINEEHPLLFKPFDHIKFLDFYNTEAGLIAKSALKAYCGV